MFSLYYTHRTFLYRFFLYTHAAIYCNITRGATTKNKSKYYISRSPTPNCSSNFLQTIPAFPTQADFHYVLITDSRSVYTQTLVALSRAYNSPCLGEKSSGDGMNPRNPGAERERERETGQCDSVAAAVRYAVVAYIYGARNGIGSCWET